jgi:Type II secretion system (T2SS), protein G
MKAEGRRQKAGRNNKKPGQADKGFTSAFCLLLSAFCFFASPAAAQKKPKPALGEKEARRVIAATPGFKLKTGAVKVKEISSAGESPVSVLADVTEAFRLAWVEDERVEQTSGVFKTKRWRAEEFRTGDRSWEGFDFLAAPGDARVESARVALEQVVTEFASRLEEQKAKDEAAKSAARDEESRVKGKKKKKEKSKGVEPLTRGALTIKSLSTMGSSAVAEVVVEATFRLSKDASGKWQVSEVVFGGEPSGSLASLWQQADARKAEHARADLAAMRDALEAFRRERGFYVVAEDSAVLMDHLSPRYIKQVIRLDPWHNPYRYTGTTAAFTLASDGPDGKPGTADDVTLSR